MKNLLAIDDSGYQRIVYHPGVMFDGCGEQASRQVISKTKPTRNTVMYDYEASGMIIKPGWVSGIEIKHLVYLHNMSKEEAFEYIKNNMRAYGDFELNSIYTKAKQTYFADNWKDYGMLQDIQKCYDNDFIVAITLKDIPNLTSNVTSILKAEYDKDTTSKLVDITSLYLSRIMPRHFKLIDIVRDEKTSLQDTIFILALKYEKFKLVRPREGLIACINMLKPKKAKYDTYLDCISEII